MSDVANKVKDVLTQIWGSEIEIRNDSESELEIKVWNLKPKEHLNYFIIKTLKDLDLDKVKIGEWHYVFDFSVDFVELTKRVSNLDYCIFLNMVWTRGSNSYSIDKELSIKNAIFTNTLDLCNTTFKSKVDFSNSYFNHTAFKETTFEQEVIFSKSIFYRQLECQEINFKENVKFTEATFEQDVSFSSAKFYKEVFFNKSKFKNNTYFGNVEFLLERQYDDEGLVDPNDKDNKIIKPTVSFDNAQFHKPVNFSKLISKGFISFAEVSFSHNIPFENSEFNILNFEFANFQMGFSLRNSTFAGIVDCQRIKSSGVINFTDAKFEKKILLTDSELKERLLSVRTQFLNNAEFNRVHFYKGIDLYMASFEGIANFGLSTFDVPLSLNLVELNNKASFYKTKMKELNTIALKCARDVDLSYMNLEGNLDFRNIIVEGCLNLEGAIAKNVYLDFSDEKSNKNKIQLLNLKKLSSTSFHINIFERNISADNRETYTFLKNESNRRGDRIQALEYHGLEMERALKEEKDFLNKCLLCFEKWSNNFGLSFVKPFIAIFLAGYLFVFLKSFINNSLGVPNCEHLWNDFKHTFRLVLDEVVPYSNIGKQEKLTNGLVIFYHFKNAFIIIMYYQFIQALRKYSRKL